jgi:hypothetical protein
MCYSVIEMKNRNTDDLNRGFKTVIRNKAQKKKLYISNTRNVSSDQIKLKSSDPWI